jgi:hypothetical protein
MDELDAAVVEGDASAAVADEASKPSLGARHTRDGLCREVRDQLVTS